MGERQLGDLINIQSGYAFKSKTYSEKGHFLVRIGNVQGGYLSLAKPKYVALDSKTQRFALNEGDFLTSLTGNIGRVARVEKSHLPAALNQRVARLTVVDAFTLSADYLYYFLTSDLFKIELSAVGHGAAQQNVSPAAIGGITIPLPPLYEQKCIVAILDEVFAGITQAVTNAEENLTNARELFESYLNSVFTQKGEGWIEKKLSEVIKTQPRNGWSPPAKNHSDKGTPVLTLSSVTGFNFDLSKIKYTSAPTKKEAHYWLDNGDLLITRSNTPQLVGHVAVCSGIEKPTIYPDLIMRMKVDQKLTSTKFLYYQLRSKKLRKLIMDSAQGANPTMKKINKGIVQGLPIDFPDIFKQKAITDKLDFLFTQTQHLESIYQQKLTALAELKQSILQKAFTGELTADNVYQQVVNG